MNFGKHNFEDNIDINVTSLIDVVLLLLIFFMVSTTFLNPQHVNLTLPEANKSITKKEENDKLEVTVDKDGRYYVNGKGLVNTQLETLKTALGEAAKDMESPPVIIHADAAATHQAVISVLDAARQLGLLHVSFATEATETSETISEPVNESDLMDADVPPEVTPDTR